jgi:hypothetical protein
MTRTFDPAISRLAWYTYATRCAISVWSAQSIEGGIHRGAYLPQVELSVRLVRDTLDLKKRSGGVGITLAALVTEYAPFAVESVVREVRWPISSAHTRGGPAVILIQ